VVLLQNFINIFSVPELRKKLFFTLGILVVYRFGVHIPVIGVDITALHQLFERAKGLGSFFSYLDMFSGGALKECTLFALGMQPYITSSIVMQMLGMTIPSLEQLLKEGEYGRKIVNQYTRYLTFAVSIFHSLTYAFILERNGLVVEPGWSFRLLFILSLTVGSMFVMWLGEQISLFGIGNGSSMIIFAGIVSQFPDYFMKTYYQVAQNILDPLIAVFILVLFVAITAIIVFLERGERKVPVQYTRRIVGQRVYGGQSTYIPFKLNTANVMPVIITGAVMSMPMFLVQMFSERFAIFKWLADNVFSPLTIPYNVIEFILIIAFSFMYTALMYNPDELADNIKKSGGFIPGIRPGKQTSEFFYYILTRVGSVGALYLATLAVIPNFLNMVIQMPFYLSGTGLLIVVGVALEMASQIEAYLIEHRYEGFLTSGSRLKGRGAR
jgi:preprotein translocase subunit SecY